MKIYNERYGLLTMKKYSVAVLGCGGRGYCYASLMHPMKEKFEIVSLCDPNIGQIEKIHKLLDLENTSDFTDVDEFLKIKRADVIVIATPDRYHIPQTVKALELGYDVLLEKPISDSRDELELLDRTQKRTGRKVVICHELRYGAGYRKCAELIKNGVIGNLYAIDASERVAYWHWAQAYVRGIGSLLENSHPVVLAKCSHDLDLLQSYAGSECDTVSSIGDRSFFRPENAPCDSAERCLECKYKNTCPYSAQRIYIDGWHEAGEPEFIWPYSKVSIKSPLTEEDIRKGLINGEYGVCAFKTKVDQVDHQLVQMTFKNGIKASLKIVYGAYPGRRIVFYGNYGEIVFDERTDEIEIMPFGEKKEIIELDTLIEGGHGHGGGDAILIRELYDIISGEKECETSLKESIECHLMGISAEESRKLGGAIVKVHK